MPLTPGSETGTSMKFANIIAGTMGSHCVGPVKMDKVPALMSLYSGFGDQSNLLIVVTSTFGKGSPPNDATKFLSALSGIDPVKINSAYVNSLYSRRKDVHK